MMSISTVVRARVCRGMYRDSVELMRAAADAERQPGVRRAALMMGTPANRALLREAGLLSAEADLAGPNDLIITVGAIEATTAEAVVEQTARLLDGQQVSTQRAADRPAPRTIAQALAEVPTANLVVISTPGAYATAEALKALKRGLHAFMFSDNVSVTDELELKQLARRKGRLMMGPDCGTAILNGVPIGFANAVRPGRIGLIGASGTGLQQVSCRIDRSGEGVSQVIGVGGRDLDERIGGLMMLSAIEWLAHDPSTEVIVLLSKPPSPVVARRILEVARSIDKPVVVNFLGGDPADVRQAGLTAALTLEDAADRAVALARGESLLHSIGTDETDPIDRFRDLAEGLAPSQRYVRGLFSGGTLCKEAALVLHLVLPSKDWPGHTLIDLGDDEYTVGRPHPMIDFRLRNEEILRAADDPSTAVILLDVVLGNGAHPDPASALAPAIQTARERAAIDGRDIAFVGSVCGTSEDPQDLNRQERTLGEAGVLLATSNARAANLAGAIVLAARAKGGD